MSTLESATDESSDAIVKATPSEPTTEQRQTAIPELNGASQPSEDSFSTPTYTESVAVPVESNNGASEQHPTSTSNPAEPANDAAQSEPVHQDITQSGAGPTDLYQHSPTWQATAEEASNNPIPPNVDELPPAFAAAQESVMQNMTPDTKDVPSIIQQGRGRGRGRPRTSNLPNGDRSIVTDSSVAVPTDQSLTTPVRRGRGGRPRGRGSARSKGKSARKRRGDGADGDMSDTDDFSDDSGQQAKDPIVTKSGRSVTKPSQYNPVVDPSPTSGTKRKRSQQPKFTDSIWCVKCLRGHSPPSNQIVLCDGCDAAYHQWCHDPLIEKEVAENIDESWFCGNCLHAKETSGLPIDQRVPAGNLSNEEKIDYLALLPKPTLVSLLVHGTSLHPDLPLFAPNTRQLLQTLPKSHVPRPVANAPLPTPPGSQSWKQQQHPGHPSNPMNTQNAPPTQQMHPASQSSPVNQEAMFPHDPYPEYSNEAGDPPATYPRPGRGPIKLQATTHPEDMPWMVQDNYEVFSHLVNDGTGRMVPMQQRPEGWPGNTGGMPAQNGNPPQPHQHPHPPQHHDYRQQMYNAPQPHSHIHPSMHYVPPMGQHPSPHPPPHPSHQFHSPDMQRPPQWNSAYGMPPAEHMQQHQQHQPQHQHQHQHHPGHPGAMTYGSPQAMQ